MSIAIQCDDCGKQYRLKDAVAGKSFSCKECDNIIRVPKAVKQKKRPTKKKRSDSNPWDDIDERDEPAALPTRSASPKKKKTKKKKASSPWLKHVALGVVMLLVLGGVGTGLWYAITNISSAVAGKDFEDVANWRKVTIEEYHVSVMIPDTKQSKKNVGVAGAITYESESEESMMKIEKLPDDYFGCSISGFKTNTKTTAQKQYAATRKSYQSSGMKLLGEKDITINSRQGKEFRFEAKELNIKQTLWYFYDVEKRQNMLLVVIESVKKPEEKLRKRFLESLQFDDDEGDDAN